MATKKLRSYVNAKGETELTLARSEKPEHELCDFCALFNPPYKVYPCKDFPHPFDPKCWSRGSWNACHSCAAFIDADDRKGLVERCAMLLEFEFGPIHRKQELEAFQEGFFNNRKESNE
jgi:hypothetical protein